MSADPAPTRAEIAGDFQDAAIEMLAPVVPAIVSGRSHGTSLGPTEAIAVAQVQATLALTQRVADLTDRLDAGGGALNDRLEEIRDRS